MSNELNITYTTGATVTASVYSPGWSLVGSTVLTEPATGLYSGDMPAAVAGCYLVVFTVSGVVIGSGTISWDGAAEVCQTDVDSKLKDVWQLRGLDSSAPATFRTDKIFVGTEGSPDIELTLTGDGASEKVATRTV